VLSLSAGSLKNSALRTQYSALIIQPWRVAQALQFLHDCFDAARSDQQNAVCEVGR